MQALPASSDEEGDQDSPASKKLKLLSKSGHVEEFLTLYRDHLMNNSTLSPTSVEVSKRLIGDFVKYTFKGQDEESFNGLALVRAFLSLGAANSFLRRGGDSLSGSYCGKILQASLRVLGLLKDSSGPARWRVDRATVDETELALNSLLKRYQKVEKRERVHSREIKERNMLTASELQRILQSKAVKNVLETAANSLEDKTLRPVTVNAVVSLRNALLTSILVRSLRRALEFTEFTVGEWKSRTLQDDSAVIRVRVHKTMSYGSADLVLNKTEERALKAYMLYARPVVTDCHSDSCPVFVSSVSSGDGRECCSKLHLSNISSIVKKVALKAGVTSRTVNTRLLRRSTISDAWSQNPDPAFRQEMSQLAGHSYETARRYYAVFDTAQQSRLVVDKLDEYRE